MNTISNLNPTLPLKSVGVALLFSVLCGPIGLLYSSVIGGALLIILEFAALNSKLYAAALIFYLVSCVWSVAATNRYNNKIIAKMSA